MWKLWVKSKWYWHRLQYIPLTKRNPRAKIQKRKAKIRGRLINSLTNSEIQKRKAKVAEPVEFFSREQYMIGCLICTYSNNFLSMNMINQNFQIFCENSKIYKISVNFRDSCKMFLKFAKIGDFSSRFSRNFVGIAGNHRWFPEIRKNIQKFSKSCKNPLKFSKCRDEILVVAATTKNCCWSTT